MKVTVIDVIVFVNAIERKAYNNRGRVTIVQP
jgi:hypothetical protein